MVRDFGVSKLTTAFKNNTVELIDKYSKLRKRLKIFENN